MKKSLTLILLVAVLAAAFFIRVWQGNTIPAILNRDEAALAYNASLIAQTGKDEWQVQWPLALKSFGDYKLPGYVFAIIPFFKLFGEHDWVVRFPSALAGTALVGLTFLFLRRVFQWNERWSLIAAVVVALQPVFVFFSRMAFEANLGLALLLAALLLLFDTRILTWKRLLVVSVLLLAAIFTYNTPLLLLPFCIPAVVFWKGWRNWRIWAPAVGVMILIGLIGASQLIQLSQQKSGITLFSDPSTWDNYVSYHQSLSGVTQKLLGSRIVFLAREVSWRWVMSFSPQFLVWEGGRHPWHTLPHYGHIIPVVYGLAALGLVTGLGLALAHFFTARFKKNKIEKDWSLTVYFIAVCLLPASITVDAPHATRSLLFFWWLAVLAVWATKYHWQFLQLPKTPTLRRTIGWCFFTFIVMFFVSDSWGYLRAYFSLYPAASTRILHGGFDRALAEAEALKTSPQDTIAVVDPDGYQYISAAWYRHLTPEIFFNTITHHLPDRIGFQYGYKVADYRFIAHAADRFPTEHILVEWSDIDQRWLVKGSL